MENCFQGGSWEVKSRLEFPVVCDQRLLLGLNPSPPGCLACHQANHICIGSRRWCSGGFHLDIFVRLGALAMDNCGCPLQSSACLRFVALVRFLDLCALCAQVLVVLQSDLRWFRFRNLLLLGQVLEQVNRSRFNLVLCWFGYCSVRLRPDNARKAKTIECSSRLKTNAI